MAAPLRELVVGLGGAPLELYVFEADTVDREETIRVLERRSSSLEVTRDEVPTATREMFEAPFDHDSVRLVRARIDGAEWTSAVHRPDQVDLQIDPADVETAESLRRLLGIMQEVAEATRKEVVLIAETVRPDTASPLAVTAPSREEMMDRVVRQTGEFVGEPVDEQERVACHHNHTEQETHFGREVRVSRKGAINAEAGRPGLVPGSACQRLRGVPDDPVRPAAGPASGRRR